MKYNSNTKIGMWFLDGSQVCERRGGLLYVDDEIIQLRMTHNTSNARCNEDII